MVVQTCGAPKIAANWVTGNLQGTLNKLELDIAASPISAKDLASLISRIKDNTISSKIAKTIFESMIDSDQSVDAIIEQKGLKQVTDDGEIERLVIQVMEENQSQVEQFKTGKEQVLGYLVGQAMKISRGKANPEQVGQLLRQKIEQAI